MSNIHALRQRKVEIRKRMQAVLDAAQTAGRNLTTQENAAHERDLSSLQKLEVELSAAETQLEAERRMPAMPDENAAWAARASGIHHPNVGMPNGTPSQSPGRGKNYSSLFKTSHNTAGFGSMFEFFAAVGKSDRLYDPRLGVLAAGTGHTESNPTTAGFLVPEEFASKILDTVIENTVVWPRASIWAMATNVLKVPGISDLDHSSGVLFGGMKAGWADELATLDLSTINTWMLQLSAEKFYIMAQSSNELLDDSNFETVLMSKMNAGARWLLDKNFLFGPGGVKPLGALSATNPSLITVAIESGQTITQPLNYLNLTNMYAALAPACVPAACWVVSTDLVPSLLQMTYPGSSGSGLLPVVSWGSGTGAGPGGKMRLLDIPVVTSEKLPVAGTVGDISLCDFSQYSIGLRRDIQIEPSRHAGFGTDSTYYRLTCRLAGQPTWQKYTTTANGRKQSPFVVLGART